MVRFQDFLNQVPSGIRSQSRAANPYCLSQSLTAWPPSGGNNVFNACKLDRRKFMALGTASLGGLMTRKLWSEQVGASASPGKFYFAVVADTHIIDDFYHGHESNDIDTSTLYQTTPRLTSARDLINSLNPSIEHVFLVGDYFHNYPSPDYDFYFKNLTRLDRAKTITR